MPSGTGNWVSRSGSFSGSGAASLPPVAPGPEGAAAAPLPEPTFRRRSLTSFPSSAYSLINRFNSSLQLYRNAKRRPTFANNEVQIVSTSSTFAAESNVCSFSAFIGVSIAKSLWTKSNREVLTVISTPSSARIKAA
jgi:hypothetical protein